MLLHQYLKEEKTIALSMLGIMVLSTNNKGGENLPPF
jgi:hypothetical protein